MSAGSVLIIVILILLVTMASGNWVFIALGMAGVIGLILTGPAMLDMVGPIVWGSLYSPTLSAIPLFVFMGEIILKSGLSAQLYSGASKILSSLPGGLLHTNVASCAVFAAISGSSIATTATIGTVAIPELKERGYDRKLTLGSIAASGTLGILIPPSINMIVYGSWVECSIGKLFIGGIIPGIIMALSFMAYIGIRALMNADLAPRARRPWSWKEKLTGISETMPILILMAFIFVTVYTGVMTPTETAGVASAIALIFVLIMRRFSWRLLHESMISAIRVTCMILMIYVGAKILVYVITFGGIPSKIPQLMSAHDLSKLQVLILLYVTYLVLGCFMDGISMIVLTMPFVLPILVALNIDIIWFGVMLIALTEMGMITPPVGLTVYVVLGLTKSSRIGEATLGEVALSILPFLTIQGLIVILLTAVPDLVMFLPNMMK